MFGEGEPAGPTVRSRQDLAGLLHGRLSALSPIRKYDNFRDEPPLMVFYPQRPRNRILGQRTFAVRTLGNAEAVVPQIREAVRRVDADLPLLNVMTQRETEARLLILERVFASITTVFGGLALVIAAIGLFGLMSYAVARRTREIGIRVALGAQKGQILGAALWDSLTLVGIGVVLGVGGSLAATRLIESMLFGLEPNDPATVLAAVAVIARGFLASPHIFPPGALRG